MSSKKLVTNLCIIHQDSRVLLGMKKRGFGAGRWNGFGGKVLAGETVEESLRREVREEAGIDINQVELLGYLLFEFQNGEVIEVHLFKVRDFQGEITESEEMKPQWFSTHEIPFTSMWPDDIYWMPLFLENKKFRGKFVFGKGDVILEKELEEVSGL